MMDEKQKKEFKEKLNQTGYPKVYENYKSSVYGPNKKPIVESWFEEYQQEKETEERNQSIELVQKAVEDLSKNIKFTAGEISTFKEALCGIGEKMNDSSNKLLRASKFYFWGSLILTTLIAFAALTQTKIINFEKEIKSKPLTTQSSRPLLLRFVPERLRLSWDKVKQDSRGS